jgi:hypothetical protein
MDNHLKKKYETELTAKLKQYVIQNSDLTEDDLYELRHIVPDIDIKEFEYRMMTIVDFFVRARKDEWKNRIQNEDKYAKSIINSMSFFENQNWLSNIPDVKETAEYLEQKRLDALENPAISREDFHKNVLNVKKLYKQSTFFELEQTDQTKEKSKRLSQRDYALAFEKLEDVALKNKLIDEITLLFKQFKSCELEYILFKNTLLNLYLFHGKDTYTAFKREIQKYDTLTIADLMKIKEKILSRK